MYKDPTTNEDPMPTNNNDIEKRLWDTADELRVNSQLQAGMAPGHHWLDCDYHHC